MENLTPVRPASIRGNTRLKELQTIKGVAKNIITQKKKNLDLEKKFFKLQKISLTRQRVRDKEKLQERKKKGKDPGIIRQEAQKQAIRFVDILKFFAGYKALQWLANPKNIESIQEIFKALKNVFKVVDYLAGIGVEGVFGGLHSVLFGSNFIERFVGFFKLLGGIFILKRLLFPGQILKDLKWILKNRKQITNIFKLLGSGKLKFAIGRIFKLLTPNLFVIYKKGLTAGVKRVILKVFGKGALKLFTKVASKIGFNSAKGFVKETLKKAVTPLKRIPVVGSILGFGLNLLFGDPLDKAAVKAIGSSIGAWLGGITMGALGSIIPVAGTAAGAGFGAVVGGLIGDWVSDKLYGFFKGFSAPKEPELAVGGIVTKPTRALIGEAGPEAVIPLPKIYDGTILNAPLGIVASSMIGGMNAVISSLGPIGLTIRPYASSLLAPYQREFGSTNYVFSSDIGAKTTIFTIDSSESDNTEIAKILGVNKSLNLIRKPEPSEEAKKARYNSGNSIREILADILNNVINLKISTRNAGTSGKNGADKPQTGNVQDASGVPGADNQEKAFNYLTRLGLSNEHAAGIVGNLMIESYTDIIPTADNGTHRGIAQWDKQHRWPALVSWAENKNKDPNTFETQLEYLSIESGYLRKFKSMSVSGVDDATHKWEELFERSGGQALDRRKQYARSVLQKYAKMQEGGLISRGDITSQFANKEAFRKHAHEGIDVGLASGTPLSFTLGGKFIKVGRTSSKEREANGGYGQYMDVQLSDGKIARLAHLSSIPKWVESGKEFPANAVIAMTGGIPGQAGSGRSGGAHLHLEQHTTKKDLAETLNGKVDPIANGLFGLLRKGGSSDPQVATKSQPPVKADSVPESETDDAQKPAEINYNEIAENLAKLYQMLNAPQKFNADKLQQDSMKYLDAFKEYTPAPDTYIISGGTNMFSQTNIITPLEQIDYSKGSFSAIDSSTAFNLKTRL